MRITWMLLLVACAKDASDTGSSSLTSPTTGPPTGSTATGAPTTSTTPTSSTGSPSTGTPTGTPSTGTPAGTTATTGLPAPANTEMWLCALTDGAHTPTFYGPNPTFTGTVVGQGVLDHVDLTTNQGFTVVGDCFGTDPFTFLTVTEDATGATWHLGWRSRNPAFPLPFSAIPVSVSDSVEVTTEFWGGIASAASMFVVERQGELRFLGGGWGDNGWSSPTQLSTGAGAVSFQAAAPGCPGTVVDSLELEILADSTVSIAPDQVGAFTLGGTSMEAINLGTWTTTPVYSTGCVDLPVYGSSLAAWAL